MTTRVLSSSEADQLFSFGEAGTFSDTVWNAPARDATAAEELPLHHDGNCLRGAAFAIGMELAAALFLYAAWHAWLAPR